MNRKLIVLSAAAIVSAAAFADRDVATIRGEIPSLKDNYAGYRAYCLAITPSEWRAIAEDALSVAATNPAAATVLEPRLAWIGNQWEGNGSKVASEFDARIAASGCRVPIQCYKLLPAATEASMASTNSMSGRFAANFPLRTAALRKTKNLWKLPDGVGEVANIVAERYAFSGSGYDFGSGLSKDKRDVLSRAAIAVKISLRRQGKTFVVKDGVNPVQSAVDALAAALDAPKMAGLKEWVAEWCPEWTWVDVTWPDDADIRAYKEDVFLGKRPLNSDAKGKLCAWLGVAEYNRFVREYNGD